MKWTNKSVLNLVGDADPIGVIEAKARELVLRACDKGWSGPPYNPLTIADLLKIPVEANSDIADARTVPTGHGVKIEFNPTQPRERVRFSIAHEIAHTLFSDVAEKTRHRARPESGSDEWQLEMLCNLAAAEFVMPVGSLSGAGHVPDIEALMVERRRFDVSAEAFLIRIAKTTSEPILVFCASPVECAGGEYNYRVDYSVGSKAAPIMKLAGLGIPADSIVCSCSAIGQTNRASEKWATGKELLLECVGIPGFPGASRPRVAGIVHFQLRDAEPDPLRLVHGDVLNPTGAGTKVVCQLVNDLAKTWGGGVARMAAKKFPNAQQEYGGWFIQIPRKARLGLVHFSAEVNGIVIASLVAQEGYGPSESPRIRYAPLEQCFATVAEFAVNSRASVHMPRIGAGESGGNWSTVEEIVRDALLTKNLLVTVYDLPPKRQAEGAQLLV